MDAMQERVVLRTPLTQERLRTPLTQERRQVTTGAPERRQRDEKAPLPELRSGTWRRKKEQERQHERRDYERRDERPVTLTERKVEKQVVDIWSDIF